MVLPCNCRHEYQDKTYGKNNRVHTHANKGYRCTVCGSMTPHTSSEAKKK
jgi:hypothetical protein